MLKFFHQCIVRTRLLSEAGRPPGLAERSIVFSKIGLTERKTGGQQSDFASVVAPTIFSGLAFLSGLALNVAARCRRTLPPGIPRHCFLVPDRKQATHIVSVEWIRDFVGNDLIKVCEIEFDPRPLRQSICRVDGGSCMRLDEC